MSKKIIALILTISFILAVFAGCAAQNNGESQNENEGKKLSIVTTIFPIYDWVNNVLGDEAANADVTMLLDTGADLHSYQPTADDIIKLSTCDLFIYVGGESDEWAEDALKNATNKNMKVINLMEVLGDRAKEEELKEGMQGEEEEEGEEEEAEYDEHVWLSVKNAEIFVDEISKALQELDAEGADAFANNAKLYGEKLTALDAQYQQAVDGAKTKVLLFGDRFPFRYLTDDYGLDYYAAFIGCSAESEASFETVTFLANKVDELKLKNIMVIETSDKKIAQTIIENTKDKNQQILVLNSMQSAAADDASYLDIMQNNLDVLTKALS